VLRRFADGRQSFLIHDRASVGLLVFEGANDREAELIRIRKDDPGTSIVQRTAAGVVRAFLGDELVTWDGAHWWSKPYAASYTKAVLESIPGLPAGPLTAILSFCVHTMSPANAGALLIWGTQAHDLVDIAGLNPAVPPTTIPRFPLADPRTQPAVRHLLSQLDGAVLLDRNAETLAVGAHLRASQASHELVRIDPLRGTRHASARRYSFDHADTLVFVVSRDGPVTVYADGAAIASIAERVDDAEPPAEFDAAAHTRRLVDCPNCSRSLQVIVAAVSPPGSTAITECVVCGFRIPINDAAAAIDVMIRRPN